MDGNPTFLAGKIAILGIVLLFASIIGAFYLGRASVQIENSVRVNPSITISPTSILTPTTEIQQGSCNPPPCSDVVPQNCTRSAPVYNNSGCLISCGQLQCESL